MEIGYYPGCALHGSSNDYEASARACLGALDVQLKEIDDWICCGATAAHSLNRKLALALTARNLSLAEREGLKDLLAPCPMCSMELLKARCELASDPALRREISAIVELDVSGETQVSNLIQVFQRIGIDRIRAAVKTTLEGIKAACSYGCLLTRPAGVVKFDDLEQPRSMEAIVEASDRHPAAHCRREEREGVLPESGQNAGVQFPRGPVRHFFRVRIRRIGFQHLLQLELERRPGVLFPQSGPRH